MDHSSSYRGWTAARIRDTQEGAVMRDGIRLDYLAVKHDSPQVGVERSSSGMAAGAA